jgi:hypothetical protein
MISCAAGIRSISNIIIFITIIRTAPYLRIDSVYVKFAGHNLKVKHRVCNYCLSSNTSLITCGYDVHGCFIIPHFVCPALMFRH